MYDPEQPSQATIDRFRADNPTLVGTMPLKENPFGYWRKELHKGDSYFWTRELYADGSLLSLVPVCTTKTD